MLKKKNLIEFIKLVELKEPKKRIRSIIINKTRTKKAKIVKTNIIRVVKVIKKESQSRIIRNIIKSLDI